MNIVSRCLELDPNKRLASAQEIVQEIELWQGPGAGTRVVYTGPGALPAYAKWVAVGVLVLAVAAGFALRSRFTSRPSEAHSPVSLLIADFDNKTGDAVFDGTLEPMLGIALEGAPFISSFNRGQAKKIANRLQPGLTQMDSKVAQLVAVREGVNVVVTGSIVQDGGRYKVSVATIDPATGKSINKEEREAANKQDVLSAAGKLAESIRKGLGDTTPESVQKAAAETFSASLPNYLVQQVTSRYFATGFPSHWQEIDVVTADLAYVDGKEDYRNFQIDGRPIGMPIDYSF